MMNDTTINVFPWTVQGTRGEVRYPVRECDTKRKAVAAMETDRAPKTQINRDGRHYTYTAREK